MNNKTEGELLYEDLSYKRNNVWEKFSEQDRTDAFEFCKEYIDFLNICKTEREHIEYSVREATTKGFVDIDEIMRSGKKLEKGMKIYSASRNKCAVFTVIGDQNIQAGLKIIGAHVDSPRIDLKPNPLYEKNNLALMETHYYGGIKNYQWVTVPLALHGVIIKRDGQKLNISIGESENEPVLCITDLLPHLSKDQMEKKMVEAIPGENLNVLVGSIPYDDEKVKEKVKLNILKLLNERYGIYEEDFLSAELQLVPAHKAKQVGIDSSMVGGYGQDDRVCSYTSFKAVLDINEPQTTCVCILIDKEEIGSEGNTGMQSKFFENFVAKLCKLSGDVYDDTILRTTLQNSKALSADVNAAVDPNFEDAFELMNSSYIGNGIVVTKYTGARGKSGASDANAEFVADIRRIFNDNGIIWQTGELGKVEKGGGGTIAKYLANLDMDVVDCGVAVLSMHSPFEITSKADIYATYKAFKAFFR